MSLLFYVSLLAMYYAMLHKNNSITDLTARRVVQSLVDYRLTIDLCFGNSRYFSFVTRFNQRSDTQFVDHSLPSLMEVTIRGRVFFSLV